MCLYAMGCNVAVIVLGKYLFVCPRLYVCTIEYYNYISTFRMVVLLDNYLTKVYRKNYHKVSFCTLS